MDEGEFCGVCRGGHDSERHDRMVEELVSPETMKAILAEAMRDLQSKYQDPRQVLAIPDGVALATAWPMALDYSLFASVPCFTTNEEGGDGVALTSMAHPDGSLLAAELAAEAEEMEAEENPDLSAITRNIARGG